MNRWLLAAILVAFLFAVGMLVLEPERAAPIEDPLAAEPTAVEQVPQIAPIAPQVIPQAEPAEGAPAAPGVATTHVPADVPAAPEPLAPAEPEEASAVDLDGVDPEAYVPQRSEGVDAYKRAYANDSADAGATTAERQITNTLREVQVPDELVQSVNCHRRVCRLRMLWNQKDPTKMMAAQMGLGTRFSPLMQVEPLGEMEGGEVTVDLYVLRPGVEIEQVQ